jgi:two-component system, NarL family, response regulator NreC
MSIRILLADDHPIIRQGVRALLEHEGLQVVGEAADGSQALRLGEELHPDVVVVDVAMPLMSGIDVARELMIRVPATKIVLLTMHEDDTYVLEALRAGVRGYVLKSETVAGLVRAIREVCRGGTYLSPALSRAVLEARQSVGARLDRASNDQER